MKILIKNGTIVTSQKTLEADLLVQDGKIAAIGNDLPSDDCECYDASGCFLFPGFIDGHTHLDMDTGSALTADDYSTGTRAAISGGTTTILDFATQEKGKTLTDALNEWHKKSDGKSSCDYGYHMAIVDWNPEVSKEIDEMTKAGVSSFKLYLAYDNLRVSDAELYEILKRVGEKHGIIGVHCENGDLVNEMIAENRAAGNLSVKYHPLSRPDYVEAEAISRYCYIARAAGVPINIVHLSTKAGLEEVRRARARGQKVYIETCPHYLTMDESLYNLPGFESAKYVCSPPLRKKSDQTALWGAIESGEVDTISTDHCSFNFKGQKDMGKSDFSKIPNGLPGIEHRPVLMYTHGVATGKMTVEQMAKLLSENTARLFGMYPRKGILAVGSDADIVVWEPSYQGEITADAQYQNVDYTPYEHQKTIGRAKAVFLRGKQVVTDGKVQSENNGIYLSRDPSEFY